jgi:hypothetical protein
LLERFDLALRQGRSLNPEEAREQLVQRRRTFASGNNVLEDKSNRILDVISVSSTMDTIFLATRKGIKFFQTVCIFDFILQPALFNGLMNYVDHNVERKVVQV